MAISRDKPEHALAEVATVSPCSDCESAVFDESPRDLRHHSESTFWWRCAVLGESHYAAAWSPRVLKKFDSLVGASDFRTIPGSYCRLQ